VSSPNRGASVRKEDGQELSCTRAATEQQVTCGVPFRVAESEFTELRAGEKSSLKRAFCDVPAWFVESRSREGWPETAHSGGYGACGTSAAYQPESRILKLHMMGRKEGGQTRTARSGGYGACGTSAAYQPE
jgi:hypothetical protein